jgi:hypothetical protein
MKATKDTKNTKTWVCSHPLGQSALGAKPLSGISF